MLGHYLCLIDKLRSRKTVHFSEQIKSADKCPSIFSRQMEAIRRCTVILLSDVAVAGVKLPIYT